MYKPGMKDTLYIIFNKQIPALIKVGITQYDGNHRAKTLCTTGVPGKNEVYRELRIKNTRKVEDKIKEMFAEYRERPTKEWYYKTALPKLDLLFDILELQQDDLIEEEENIEMLFETILSDRKRKEKLKFSMIKLSIGDELEYVEDPSIKVKIVDDKCVEYENERYTLSALTAKLDSNRVSAYQGPAWWCYDGKKLSDIRKEMEKTTSI
jgi:hypothetical protein